MITVVLEKIKFSFMFYHVCQLGPIYYLVYTHLYSFDVNIYSEPQFFLRLIKFNLFSRNPSELLSNLSDGQLVLTSVPTCL